MRRLGGLVLVACVFAIGYVLVKGVDGVYEVGGADGFVLSGGRVLGAAILGLVGSVALLAGLSETALSRAPAVFGGALIIGGLIFGVTGDVKTKTVEGAPTGDPTFEADRSTCREYGGILADSEDLSVSRDNFDRLRSRFLALDASGASLEIEAAVEELQGGLTDGDELAFERGGNALAAACDERFPGGGVPE